MLKGVVPRDFNTWVNFYEIGPKSASLILFAAFGLKVAVPVDVHVLWGLKDGAGRMALVARNARGKQGSGFQKRITLGSTT